MPNDSHAKIVMLLFSFYVFVLVCIQLESVQSSNNSAFYVVSLTTYRHGFTLVLLDNKTWNKHVCCPFSCNVQWKMPLSHWTLSWLVWGTVGNDTVHCLRMGCRTPTEREKKSLYHYRSRPLIFSSSETKQTIMTQTIIVTFWRVQLNYLN